MTRIVGPGIAGALVQLVSAPTAMVVDAISFAFSAGCLWLIDSPEEQPSRAVRRGIAIEIYEGLYLVMRHRLVRPLLLSGGAYNFFAAIFVAVYALFMVRELGLAPTNVGAIIACGGAGGVPGGLLAEPFARRFGPGRAIVSGMLVLAAMHLAAPVAIGPPVVTIPLLAGAGLLAQLGLGVMAVNRTSLIQQVVPAYTQGRVAATQQVVVLAAVPIGAALGGLIADGFGLRATLSVAAFGTIVATIPLVRSGLWTLVVAEGEQAVEGSGVDDLGQPPAPTPGRLWKFRVQPFAKSAQL